MNAFEKLQNFEEQPLSSIIYNMVKWYNFEAVHQSMHQRDNVESGVWLTLKIFPPDANYDDMKAMHISAQGIDILKERLIKYLRQHLNLPPAPKCVDCGKIDDTVKARKDGYGLQCYKCYQSDIEFENEYK